MQFLHCLTPLHNGAGQGLGGIDRPLIREVTTGYPFVQSSTLKGAFKGLAGKGDWQSSAFGAPGTDGHQGCALFGDANLLLFPARSLAGTFAWITTAPVLARYARLADLAGDPNGLGAAAGKVAAATQNLGAATAAGTSASRPVLAIEDRYFLEGSSLTVDSQPATDVDALAGMLASVLFEPGDAFWPPFFRARLLVVDADVFVHFVNHATQVEANIEIGEKGVTTEGSLRYTEFLPAETVLYHLLQVETPLGGGSTANVIETGLKALPTTIQLGADESKGKGIARWSALS
jgi:CRISPR-associated protein Cmr4